MTRIAEDSKGRKYAFRPVSGDRWQVLVFEPGKKGVQRVHHIKLLEIRATGKMHWNCNCPAKYYSKDRTKNCRHEEAFLKYMEKFVKK